LYSIVYVSTGNPTVEDKVIEAIFEDFKAANEALGICGILMYSEGNFFQILEIEYTRKDIIIDLFEKIKKDDRHHDIIKITEHQTVSRAFSKYVCTFITLIKPGEISDLYKFLRQEKIYNPKGYEGIAYLTQKFLTLI